MYRSMIGMTDVDEMDDDVIIPEKGIVWCDCGCGFDKWEPYKGHMERVGVELSLRMKHKETGCLNELEFSYEIRANGS